MIQLNADSAEHLSAAREKLAGLVHDWGCNVVDLAAPTGENMSGRDDKVIDPISLTALVVSLPSAALAVFDLADRIRKRRRAQELIDQARLLAEPPVTARIRSGGIRLMRQPGRSVRSHPA